MRPLQLVAVLASTSVMTTAATAIFGSTSTGRCASCRWSSGRRWCYAISVGWITPRSPRSSTSRPARSALGSPEVAAPSYPCWPGTPLGRPNVLRSSHDSAPAMTPPSDDSAPAMTPPHLDDEALSASLDGEATADEVAHLATCGRCQAARQALAIVARAVATPVTPRAPAAVDAAIAAALGNNPTEVPVSSTRPTGEALRPRPMGPMGPRTVTASASPNRRPPRWILTASGVAAAVILVGGLVGIIARSSSTSSKGASTAAPATVAKGAVSGGLSSTVPGVSSSSVAPVYGVANQPPLRDLGDQSDAQTVARLVTEALAAPSASAGPLLVPAAASTTPAPTVAPTPCVAEAASALGIAGNDAPRYAASLTWRGQAAVAVVFSMADRLAGAVMKTAGCSLLATLPL